MTRQKHATVGTPHAELEAALIDEFLRSRGTDRRRLRTMPEEEAKRLMTEASAYAQLKLTELESRARFVQDVQGTTGRS